MCRCADVHETEDLDEAGLEFLVDARLMHLSVLSGSHTFVDRDLGPLTSNMEHKGGEM